MLVTSISFVYECFMLFIKCIACYCVFVYRRFVRKRKKDIRGEIALVTGGAHGIGRELCICFAREGATVVIMDINNAGAEETAAMIKREGGSAFVYFCDVSKNEEVKRVADSIRKSIGDVTIVVNNAAILNGIDILNLREDQIRKNFEINNLAHFWIIKAFLPRMIALNRGHIVNMASLGAFSGVAYLTDYGASKFGVSGLSSYLQQEIRLHYKKDITVSCVYPHFTSTGLIKHMHSRFDKILTPNEVAEMTVDEVLRGESLIYIPGRMRYIVGPLGLIPLEVVSLLLDFSGSRIGLNE